MTTTMTPPTRPKDEVIYDLPVKPFTDSWTNITRQPAVMQVACCDPTVNQLMAQDSVRRKKVLKILADWYGFNKPTPQNMARPFYLPDRLGPNPTGNTFMHPVAPLEVGVSSNINVIPTTGCCGAKLLATFPGYIDKPVKETNPLWEVFIHRHLDYLIKKKDASSSGIYYIFLTTRQANLYDVYLTSYGFYRAGERFKNPKTSSKIVMYAFHPDRARLIRQSDTSDAA